MITTGLIIGLLTGLIIGYFLGKQSSTTPIDKEKPDHKLSDSDIDKINDNLLLDGGNLRAQVPSGKTIRYTTFVDALLMDLNSSNNHLILDHCKNLDTAIRILEQAQKDNDPDFPGFTLADYKRIEDLVKKGTPIPFAEFSRLCPPPDKPPKTGAAKALWGPVSMKVVANIRPEIKAEVSLKDPNGKILEVHKEGVIYDFGSVVQENGVSGIYTIMIKIQDLELGKTASFEREFEYQAEDH